MRRVCIYLIVSAFLHASHALGQSKGQPSVIAWPILFNTPETGIGGGVAGGINFYLQKRDSASQASQVQFGAVFTERSRYQIYLPFNLVFENRKHQLYGEAGYYQFSLLYYGLGRDDNAKGLRYNTNITRLRLHYLHRLSKNLYAGARWWYERMQIPSNFQDAELLPLYIPGSKGSVMSGPGVVLMLDTRNHLYLTRQGFMAEVSYHDQRHLWGSEYTWQRWRVEGRFFHSPTSWLTIASQCLVEKIDGIAPFLQWPGIGGSRRMRGYYEGRFRDRSAAILNLELRSAFWHRLGLAAFSGLASVASSPGNFSSGKIHTSSGAGLRWLLDKEKGITLRLDAAKGSGPWLFYFAIGESF